MYKSFRNLKKENVEMKRNINKYKGMFFIIGILVGVSITLLGKLKPFIEEIYQYSVPDAKKSVIEEDYYENDTK